MPCDLEFPFTTVKGKKIWIRTTAQAEKENGKIVYVIGNIINITERVQAGEELEKHRFHLEMLVEERTAELRRIVNLMTGREERMAELKKGINKLRGQLEEAGLDPEADDLLFSKEDG